MTMNGAAANRRRLVEREFSVHAREIAERMAAQFQPVYERVCRERDEAVERASVLQSVVERVALGHAGSVEARQLLDQLGINPDVQTEPADD